LVSSLATTSVLLGFLLIAVGVALVFVGTLYAALRSAEEGKVEGGGVVFIGPVPIVWGTSKAITQVMLVLALILTAALALLYVLLLRAKPA